MQLISYDQRGFGETEPSPGRYSSVDDLGALLDQESSERVVLVGNSMGGRIALDAALAMPDRVAALVLLAPAVSGAPEVTLDDLDAEHTPAGGSGPAATGGQASRVVPPGQHWS